MAKHCSRYAGGGIVSLLLLRSMREFVFVIRNCFVQLMSILNIKLLLKFAAHVRNIIVCKDL